MQSSFFICFGSQIYISPIPSITILMFDYRASTNMGARFLVKDINFVDAQILKSAFDSAGIDCCVTSEGFGSNANDKFLAVRVGPKPK